MVDLERQKPSRNKPHPLVARGKRRLVFIGAFVVLVGISWAIELHALLWYRINCEYLSHRAHEFVRHDNNYLCLADRELLTVLRDITATAAALFEAHNVTYFLESGTLLGSFREKGVIRHDTDVDLGIDGASLTYLQQNHVEVPAGYALYVWNSTANPTSTRDDKLPVRLVHKETALYADVFAFLDWKDDHVGPLPSVCFKSCKNCAFVGEYRQFTVPREWVYPLVDCPFEGQTYKCPRESAKYLEHMYGKNYMTPS